MKRLFNVRMLMLTALLLMGAFTTASAQRPATFNRPIAVDHPFAFRGTGLAHYITDGAGNITGATLTIAGTVTPLSLWAAAGELQFTPDPDNPTLVHASGTATFTTDNGEQINTVMKDGVLDLNSLLSTGSLQFVGGTGRYSNASGSVNFVVGQSLLSGAFETTMVGALRY
jgi:hypothetical protein